MSDPPGQSIKTSSIINVVRRAALTRAITFRTKRLIVFLTPGFELRTGGVLSIAAIYRASMALVSLHRAKVALCAVPGDPLLPKYTWFDNHNYILELESVLRHCKRLDYLMLQIPEYAVNRVLDWLMSPAGKLLVSIGEVHLNVLLQNIDQLKGQNLLALKAFGRVTCTTAHDAYTNSGTREELGVTLHKLGVRTGPECYARSSYSEKESILLVSHDPHSLKQQILDHIAQEHPGLKIEVIRDLHYDEYKKLTRRAKWSLTFGEGLDGYFAETVWSGGLSFAVYNSSFFTPAFAELETVYSSWEALAQGLTGDLQRLDEPTAYARCWEQAYNLLGGLYGIERFRDNLRAFYLGNYTFP